MNMWSWLISSVRAPHESEYSVGFLSRRGHDGQCTWVCACCPSLQIQRAFIVTEISDSYTEYKKLGTGNWVVQERFRKLGVVQ